MPDLNLRSPSVPLRPVGADGYRVPRPEYDLSLSYGRESRRAIFEPLAKVTDALIGLQMHQAQNEAEAIAQKQINSQQEELNQQFTELQTLKMQDAIEGGKKFKQNMADMMRKQNEANAESQPLIRNAVQKASDDLRLSYGAKVDAYVMQETFNFKNSEMLSAIELTTNDLITNYNNPELRQKYTAKLINQQGMQLDFNGINKGTKAYEVGIMNTLDKAHDTVINDMINVEKFGEAKSAIDTAFGAKQMSAATRNDLLARLFDARQRAADRAAARSAYNAQRKYYDSLYRPLSPSERDAFIQKHVQDFEKDTANHTYKEWKRIDILTPDGSKQNQKLGNNLLSTQNNGGVLGEWVVKKYTPEQIRQNAYENAVFALRQYELERQAYQTTQGYDYQRLAKVAAEKIAQNGKLNGGKDLFSSESAYQQAVVLAVSEGKQATYYEEMAKGFNLINNIPNLEAQKAFDALTNEEIIERYPTADALIRDYGLAFSPQQMEKNEAKREKIVEGNNEERAKNTFKPAYFKNVFEHYGVKLDNKDKPVTAVDQLVSNYIINTVSKEVVKQAKDEALSDPEFAALISGITTDPYFEKLLTEGSNKIKANAQGFASFLEDPSSYEMSPVIGSDLQQDNTSENPFVKARTTAPYDPWEDSLMYPYTQSFLY